MVGFPQEEYNNKYMTTFPEDIECVYQPLNGKGAIFISNIEAASNPQTLAKHGIGAVITAIKGKNLDNVIPKHIEYLYVPALDSQKFDISFYFNDTFSFIDEQRKRTNVLVHCMAGVSRSVTLVLAYLIKKFHMAYEEAFSYVKSRRNMIHPNQGFIEQLKQYQLKLKQNTLVPNNQHVEMKPPTKKEIKPSAYDQSLKENIKKCFMSKTSTASQNNMGFLHKNIR